MLVFTQNVKSNPLMRRKWVAEDVQQALTRGGIGFWQEFEPAYYKKTLHHLAGLAKRVVCGHVECPVTVNARVWPIEDVRTHLMHKGRPLCSPNRYCTVVKTRRGQKKVAFIATHFISGAWNSKRKTFKAWRKRMWNQHHMILSGIIRALHDEGYTVVLGGDFNRLVRTMPKFHEAQRTVAASGIDGIIVVPAEGWKVTHKAMGVHRKGLHTDHPTVVGRIGVKRA